MNAFKLLAQEILAIIKNPKLLIPVIAVILIPLLYSATFLWAFWDPYAKLDNLPVAVVNMDQSAKFEGKTLTIGQDLTEKLKDNQKFQWRFVDQKTAEDGLRNDEYYMVIEIPEDFSQKATTVMNDQPEPLAFRFIPNDSYNFLASQIGESAMEKIKEEINNNLTQAYTQAMFDNMDTLASGLSTASDGSHQLASGTADAENAVNKIKDNLYQIAAGTEPLKEGVNQLAQGSQQLENGLVVLQKGSSNLSSGLEQLNNGHQQLIKGAQEAQAGLSSLQNGLASSVNGTARVQAGAWGLVSDLNQFATDHPELAEDPQLQQLMGEAKTVAAGVNSVGDGQKKLASGATKVAAGQGTIIAGMETFGSKLAEAQSGSVHLVQGTEALMQGSSGLNNGIEQLGEGANKLSDSTYKLSQGTKKLSDGMGSLVGGSNELADKLSDAANETSKVKGNSSIYNMFAQPVDVQKENINNVPNYGTGFAPYFLSLGLYVGALILTIVFPLKESVAVPKSGFGWYFSKTMILTLVGVAQALIAAVVLLNVLGIEVKSVPLFLAFSIITSLTFMALIQCLITVFDNPGRFAAILILIFQLVSSAGTFPLELLPQSLQTMNHWLPMTYSVAGFKAVISSGMFAFMWQNAKVLASFTGVLSLVTLIYFVVIHRRSNPAQNRTSKPEEVVTV